MRNIARARENRDSEDAKYDKEEPIINGQNLKIIGTPCSISDRPIVTTKLPPHNIELKSFKGIGATKELKYNT